MALLPKPTILPPCVLTVFTQASTLKGFNGSSAVNVDAIPLAVLSNRDGSLSVVAPGTPWLGPSPQSGPPPVQSKAVVSSFSPSGQYDCGKSAGTDAA